MAKQMMFQETARAQLKDGLSQLADAVKVTLTVVPGGAVVLGELVVLDDQAALPGQLLRGDGPLRQAAVKLDGRAAVERETAVRHEASCHGADPKAIALAEPALRVREDEVPGVDLGGNYCAGTNVAAASCP